MRTLARIKRLPIIRHIRALWLARRVEQWAKMWGSFDVGFGEPNPSDIEHLRRIWDGKE